MTRLKRRLLTFRRAMASTVPMKTVPGHRRWTESRTYKPVRRSGVSGTPGEDIMPDLFKHPIRQVTFIAAPPEKVFDTIASADGWNSFFTTGMQLEAEPGGSMLWKWVQWGPDFYDTEVPATVVEVDRPERFSFDWGTKMPTRVTFDLEAKHGGTVVTVTEEGYPDNDEGRDMAMECATGWGEAVTLLKFFVEHGITYTQPKKNR
ncbi:hypothetical protein GF377_00560 [candidate division GN15 bacterium]|nr:hypothetical protein [candidate division GN15 bacterium]